MFQTTNQISYGDIMGSIVDPRTATLGIYPTLFVVFMESRTSQVYPLVLWYSNMAMEKTLVIDNVPVKTSSNYRYFPLSLSCLITGRYSRWWHTLTSLQVSISLIEGYINNTGDKSILQKVTKTNRNQICWLVDAVPYVFFLSRHLLISFQITDSPRINPFGNSLSMYITPVTTITTLRGPYIYSWWEL